MDTPKVTFPAKLIDMPARQYDPGDVWREEPATIDLVPLLADGWECIRCSRLDQHATHVLRGDLGPDATERVEIPALHGWRVILRRHYRQHGVEWSARLYLWVPDPAFA